MDGWMDRQVGGMRWRDAASVLLRFGPPSHHLRDLDVWFSLPAPRGRGDSGSLQQPFPLVTVSVHLRDVLTALFRSATEPPDQALGGGVQPLSSVQMLEQLEPLACYSGSCFGDGGGSFYVFNSPETKQN